MNGGGRKLIVLAARRCLLPSGVYRVPNTLKGAPPATAVYYAGRGASPLPRAPASLLSSSRFSLASPARPPPPPTAGRATHARPGTGAPPAPSPRAGAPLPLGRRLKRQGAPLPLTPHLAPHLAPHRRIPPLKTPRLLPPPPSRARPLYARGLCPHGVASPRFISSPHPGRDTDI